MKKNSFYYDPLNLKEISINDYKNIPFWFSLQVEDLFMSFTSRYEVDQKYFSKLKSMKKALSLNIEMQKLVKVEIQRLKVACQRNLEKQVELENVNKELEKPFYLTYKCQYKTVSPFAAPYFHDTRWRIAPQNEDAVIKRKNVDVNSYLMRPKPWSSEEKEKLLRGVLEFAIVSALKPYKIKKNYLKGKLNNNSLTSSEVQVIKERLTCIKNEMKSVSERPLCELLDEIRGRIDWLIISSVHLNAFRNPEECENMWNNVLDFSINKGAFTTEEDEILLYLAEKYNEREWDIIADKLQTKRSAVQCFVRYQRKLNKKRRYWSKMEDDRLLTITKELKCGDFIPWGKVSKLMEDRTRCQCRKRYKVVQDSVGHSVVPWTPEEHALLIACYDKFGPQWTKIKPFFKRRSPSAIRSRYVLSLDPCLKFSPWTKDEDKHLISLIKKYGFGNWAKLCIEMPGRSSFMCMRRADLLLKHSVEGTIHTLDIYDPELFAKILKPFGPKISSYLKVRTVRKDAIVALLKAIEKVFPNMQVELENLNSVNFSWLSVDQLYQVSEELHRTFLQREELESPAILPRNYPKEPLYQKFIDEIDVDDPGDEIQDGKGNEWWYSVLDIFIKMESMNMQPPFRRRSQVLNERELAEISMYKAFLYKKFNCLAVCDDDDDLKNVTFSDADYSKTVPPVVYKFVQPPLTENQFFVLAPNLTTICGLEIVEITENRLKSMSGFVSHSKDYINFICGQKKSCPKCLQCLNKNCEQRLMANAENNQNGVSPQDVISYMEEKHFIVNKAIKESAYVESASKEKCVEACSCDSLKTSLKSVQLLKKRFIGLFLWPALLSASNFTAEQSNLLCREREAFKNDHFPKDSERYYPRKRKKKIVSERTGVRKRTPKLKKVEKNFKVEELQRNKRTCVMKRKINYCEDSE